MASPSSAHVPVVRNDASTSRLSILVNNIASSSFDPLLSPRNRRRPPSSPSPVASRRTGKYTISSVLGAVSTLPSTSSYLPSALSSFSTTFTSSGTLPAASSSLSSSSSKPVAQRRAHAPVITLSPAVEGRRVLRDEFDRYLQEIGDGYERWEKQRKLGVRGRADLGALQDERRSSLQEEQDEMDRTIENQANKELLPRLEDVPAIFFEPTFDLANPRTFDLVTEKIGLTPMSSPTISRTRPHQSALSPTSSSSLAPSSSAILLAPSTSTATPSFDSRGSPRPGTGPLTLAALATDEHLQETLSHRTAIVEAHLVREIARRSAAFFAALSNLQALQAQGAKALDRIRQLRASLVSDAAAAEYDNMQQDVNGVGAGAGTVGGAAKRGMEIVRAQARRRGLERIERAVREVDEVRRGVEAVRELVEGGEWSDALDVADAIEERFSSAGEDRRYGEEIELRKVKSLEGVLGRLAALRATVAAALRSELVDCLGREMELAVAEYLDSSPAQVESTNEWRKEGSDGGASKARDRAKDRIRPVVKGLVRADGVEGAVAVWKESVLQDVRSIVKEYLPPSYSSASTTVSTTASLAASAAVSNIHLAEEDEVALTVADKSLTLANNLRSLSHLDFLALAEKTYSGLLGCIEVVDLHSKVLLELTNEAKETVRSRKSHHNIAPEDSSPEPTLNVIDPNGASVALPASIAPSQLLVIEDSSTLSSDLSDVVYAAAELAHLRFSKIISVRTARHSTLSLLDFLAIFDLSWSFVLSSEIVVRRMIVGLRGMMLFQSKSWLGEFHMRRTSEMAKSVEEEVWVPKEIEERVQKGVLRLVESAIKDPREFLLGSRSKHGDAIEGKAETNGEHETTKKLLDIEGKEYFAVTAGLHTLEVLEEYLMIVINCPLLTTDAMSKIVEYMKSFNSRTCQVVLGAGAMRSAGLKNITAKHLALASQALSIMIALIPYIRETLRRHLNPKQAVMLIEFDKLRRDYQEHQNEIHSKLIAIMGDRLHIHCKALHSIPWEATPSSSSPPNAYMETLVKEHTTLHKVLSRFLHLSTVEYIMAQVFTALNARLLQEFGEIEVASQAAKDRMRGDIEWMKARLDELKGLEAIKKPGDEIMHFIAAKVLPAPVVPIALAPASLPPPVAPIPTSIAKSTPVLPTPTVTPILTSYEVVPAVDPASPRPYVSRRALAAAAISAPSSPLISQPSSDLDTLAPLAVVEPPLAPIVFHASSSAPSMAAPSLIEESKDAASVELAAASPVRKKSMAERLSEVAQRRPNAAAAKTTPLPAPPPNEEDTEPAVAPVVDTASTNGNGKMEESVQSEPAVAEPAALVEEVEEAVSQAAGLKQLSAIVEEAVEVEEEPRIELASEEVEEVEPASSEEVEDPASNSSTDQVTIVHTVTGTVDPSDSIEALGQQDEGEGDEVLANGEVENLEKEEEKIDGEIEGVRAGNVVEALDGLEEEEDDIVVEVDKEAQQLI